MSEPDETALRVGAAASHEVDARNEELARLLASLMIERRDRKAVQFRGGQGQFGYMPHIANSRGWQERSETAEYLPFRLRDLVDHVTGTRTYGHYLVNPENNSCRMFCFDIDLEKTGTFGGETINPREVWRGPTNDCKRDLANQMRDVAEALAFRAKLLLDVKVLVSYSGSKGMHVIGCLEPGTPAADAREMMALVLDFFSDTIVPARGNNFFTPTSFPSLSIETYPKQAEVDNEDGFGNLLRLPLGIHLKTGKPSFFLDLTKPRGTFGQDDPLLALTKGSIR